MTEKEALATVKHDYNVKNVKFFRGMEGQGFNSTLYRGNIKVADVDDDGNGGCFHFYYHSKKEEDTFLNFLKTIPEYEYVNEIGSSRFVWKFDEDSFVNHIVNEYDIKKRTESAYKRKCKKSTVVLLKSHKLGQYLVYKSPYSETLKERIKITHGKDLLEIVNERYL